MPNRPMPILFAGLLLAVPLAYAGEYRHPSGFEPKPVFEDEAPARKPFPVKPAPVPKATPATAQPPEPAEESPKPGPAPLPVAAPTAPAAVADSIPTPMVQSVPPAPAEPVPTVRGSESLSTPLIENYPAWLIVLALGGFVIWTQRQPRMASDNHRPVAGDGRAEPGRTGVARYLERMAADEPRQPG